LVRVPHTRLWLNFEATRTSSAGWQEPKMEQQGNHKGRSTTKGGQAAKPRPGSSSHNLLSDE
jgi:hypothetical protein